MQDPRGREQCIPCPRHQPESCRLASPTACPGPGPSLPTMVTAFPGGLGEVGGSSLPCTVGDMGRIVSSAMTIPTAQLMCGARAPPAPPTVVRAPSLQSCPRLCWSQCWQRCRALVIPTRLSSPGCAPPQAWLRNPNHRPGGLKTEPRGG